ncbi:MAG: hypothetical protein ACR2OV_09310 [Hyphomicrobiaceae bacterium]
MRYLTLALLGFTLVGCEHIPTPAQRCVGYTGAIMRYERILSEGEALTEVQKAAYDFAIAGQAATCDVLPPE